MKLYSASLALLGLAMLATASSDNAAPTRPESALRIPRPSTLATATLVDAAATGAAAGQGSEETWLERQQLQNQGQSNRDGDQLFRIQARDIARTSKFTKAASSSSSAGVTSASITAIAVFTVDQIPYTVTSVAGTEEVDGRTLTAGAPAQLIAGVDVAENSKGNLVANGQTIKFSAFSGAASSSSAPATLASSSSSAPPASASASASSGSGSGSGGKQSSDAATARTGHAKAAAVLGAVVGMFVL